MTKLQNRANVQHNPVFRIKVLQTIGNLTASFLNSRFTLSVFLISYIIFLLILPLSTLIFIVLKNEWSIVLARAFDPIALAAYSLTLKMAFCAAFINTIFGFIITWVLTRYTFKGKKYLDAAVDLPFALPTSVAGLTLTTVYGEQGWIGKVFNSFHIQIVFTQLGVL